MMVMEKKCDVCGINRACIKDYRDLTDQGMDVDVSYWVCYNCLNLNNYWFLKLYNAKNGLGKKRVISKIVEGDWKEWVIK